MLESIIEYVSDHFAATRDMLQLLLPKSAENSSLRYDLSDRQDRPTPQAMRLQIMYDRFIALKRLLGETCVV
jgi:hypothetical protein